MNLPGSFIITAAACVVLSGSISTAAESTNNANTNTTSQTPALPRSDANGNPLRRAPTGHVSNYDESKVGNYTLPDPLRLQNGQAVRNADEWFKQRRPEILKLYETEIYGRIPDRAPKLKFEASKTESALDGTAIHKEI